jgi:hypothetical protein
VKEAKFPAAFAGMFTTIPVASVISMTGASLAPQLQLSGS